MIDIQREKVVSCLPIKIDNGVLYFYFTSIAASVTSFKITATVALQCVYSGQRGKSVRRNIIETEKAG